MKTLYKNSGLIALVILGAMLTAAGTAVAVSQDRYEAQVLASRPSSPELIGRFVVTPTKVTLIATSTTTTEL